MRTGTIACLLAGACSFTSKNDPVGGDCLGAWCRRKSITVVPGMVAGGPHAELAMLVSLADDRELASEARADGLDIRFTADDGATPLPHQRVRFTPSGSLIAWVNVASLTPATSIYMYWGNPNSIDQQDIPATWSASYAGVWHLDESTGGAAAMLDATTNANHGTTNGASAGVTGLIGNGVDFDGADDYLQIQDSANLDATAASATLSMWARFTDPSAGRYQFLLVSSNCFGTPNDGYSWAVQPDGDHYIYPWVGNMNAANLTTNPFRNDTWHHVAATFTWGTKDARIFVDGVQKPVEDNVSTAWTQLAAPQDWQFGGTPARAGESFGGTMDELRVATVVRTPDWIQTEFRNQSSPSTFYTVGPAVMLE